MATTATSAATSSTSVNILKSLGTGSGIDLKQLAQDLVNATRAPREDLINKAISQSEARVSGYAAVSYGLSQLQKSFDAIKGIVPSSTMQGASSNASVLGVSLGDSASLGSHQVTVSQLARAQKTFSQSLASPSTALGTLSPTSYSLSVAGTALTINSNTTISDIATQINGNASLQAKGISASVVQVGSPANQPYRLVLTGASGASNSFTVTGNVAGALGLSAAPAGSTKDIPDQAALDAAFTVDGMPYYRSSNTINDNAILNGITLNLMGTTISSGPVAVSVTRDVSSVKDKLKQLVSDYNDVISILDAASDPNSTVDKFGASLVGDASVRTVRDQLRSMIIDDSNKSGSSPSPLSKLGIGFDTKGKLQIATRHEANVGTAFYTYSETVGDDSQMSAYLQSNFDTSITMLQGNALGAPGLAGAASSQLKFMTSYAGILQSQTRDQQSNISSSKDRLSQLADQMQQLLDRYTKQFSAMDSLVAQNKALGTSITNSFNGMNNR